MKQNLFYRNVRARGNLELLLLAAITTVLANRFLLYLTNYPQIGGGQLHIAHLLYGGLLMLVAMTLVFSFLGERVRRLAALIGGVGFGFFIDELGKFITKDNNYFFRPTIGLIYAIFVIIYLVFNFLGRTSRLTAREYELNALNQFEEAVLLDLDNQEKRRIYDLLAKADPKSFIAKELRTMLKKVETVPGNTKPSWVELRARQITELYRKFWARPTAVYLVAFLFIAQALSFLVIVVAALFSSFDTAIGLDTGNDAYANRLLVAEFISSAIASGFTLAGAIKLLSSRAQALELFRKATLINLLLTEFFLFTRIEFRALTSFLINVLILVGIHYAITAERRLSRQKPKRA